MNKTQKIETGMELVRILICLLIAYAAALVILFLIADDPWFVIKTFITGPFSSPRRIGSVINQSIPFILCGLSMCFVYAVNKFNLAAEGIFMMSGCMVALVGLSLADYNLPSIVMMIIVYAVAIVTGIVLDYIPAILDRKFNANVVVVSLMLNSIVGFFAYWVLQNKLADPKKSSVESRTIPASIQMPDLFGKLKVPAGLIIALVCTVIVSIVFYRTSFGWKMRIVGSNPRFAKATGLNVLSISFAAQLAGGALAGIAGATEFMDNYKTFKWTTTTGHGFDGLLVAVLAKKNPRLVPIGALFLAYIRIGAEYLNSKSNGAVPKEFITVIQGIIILLIAAESFLSGTKNKIIFKEAQKRLDAEKAKNTAAA